MAPNPQNLTPGSKRRRFSQREVARLERVNPDKIVRVYPDGVIELIPRDLVTDVRNQANEWDDVK